MKRNSGFVRFSFFQIVQLFGNARVQKTPGGVFLHQNVGRFQVAMDNLLTMGVLNRFADTTKQTQGGFRVKLMLRAVFRYRHPFHVLHHKPWGGIGKRSSIVEAGNVWMSELALGFDFVGEARQARRRSRAWGRNFAATRLSASFLLASQTTPIPPSPKILIN